MPASVVIALDTTAPALTLGPATYPSGKVHVEFEVDETAVVAGDFVAPDGTRTAGVVDGTALVFEVGLTTGRVEAEAVDLVGNRSTATFAVGVSVGRLVAYVADKVAMVLTLGKRGDVDASASRAGEIVTSDSPSSDSEVSGG